MADVPLRTLTLVWLEGEKNEDMRIFPPKSERSRSGPSGDGAGSVDTGCIAVEDRFKLDETEGRDRRVRSRLAAFRRF